MGVKNSYFDSLWTSDYRYQIVTIGGITDDPFFGKTAAGLYFQIVPPTANFTFPTGVVIDSSVLSVPYMNFAYGDTSYTNLSHALHLKAYQITEAFSLGDGTRKYYVFDKVGYNTTPIGSATVPLKALRDTVKLSTGDSIGRVLRIKMDPALNTQFATMDPVHMVSGATFMDYFKGIYLGPDTTVTQNTLGSFVLSAGSLVANYASAQLEFYYRTSVSDTVTKKAYFRFDPTICNFYNNIYRNYNGVPALNYLSNQAANRDSIVLQGYPGFRSDITIKIDTANLPPAVINKAELRITAIKINDDNRFVPPPQLIVRGFRDDGSERQVADILNGDDSTANSSGPAFVGGLATTVTIGTIQYIQYKLNVPRELQRIMSEGKSELKLRLSIPTAYQGVFRMVADGPNSSNPDTRLRFNVIYTKLN